MTQARVVINDVALTPRQVGMLTAAVGNFLGELSGDPETLLAVGSWSAIKDMVDPLTEVEALLTEDEMQLVECPMCHGAGYSDVDPESVLYREEGITRIMCGWCYSDGQMTIRGIRQAKVAFTRVMGRPWSTTDSLGGGK